MRGGRWQSSWTGSITAIGALVVAASVGAGASKLVTQVERGHPVLCKGGTAPGMFALLATRYFREYGIDEGSGVRMVNDVVNQLLGRAGRMQVAGARTGFAHTLGGPGAVSCVAILGQP